MVLFTNVLCIMEGERDRHSIVVVVVVVVVVVAG
jgi:hypothetical protein